MTRKVNARQLWFLSVSLALLACGNNAMDGQAPGAQAAPAGEAAATDATAAAVTADPAADPTADPTVVGGPAGATEAAAAPPGEPIRGLTADEVARFNAGQEEFASEEDADEGLGPIFNGRSCAECHNTPRVGGGKADQTETRFGSLAGGKFDPLPTWGGSLIQVKTIGLDSADVLPPGCAPPHEVVPTLSQVPGAFSSGRRSTPLFGFGLINTVPDGAFGLLVQLQRRLYPGQVGRVGQVHEIVSNRDRPGRFGWKGQVPSTHQFAGDAYLNEMGITTAEFPTEPCPNGDCSLIAACNVFDGVTVTQPNDDGTGPKAFEDFMNFLAPPQRGSITQAATRGNRVFNTVGCNHCHVGSLVSGNSPTAALRFKVFHPYSDFLLHDMGSLGDGVALGAASGNEFRTAPLWGLRNITRYLHDGRATSLPEAIQAHAGQGAQARDAYGKLNAADKDALLQFLNSL